MKYRLSTVSHKLRVTLITHCFMFGISTPFLLLWNLSHSSMTCIGNSIFSPFFIFFTFVSTLIFFTELMHLPNSLFITTLEKIQSLWLATLNLGKQTWLFEYALPHSYASWGIFFLLIVGLLSLRPSPFDKRKLMRICCFIMIGASLTHIHHHYFLEASTEPGLPAQLEIERMHNGTLRIRDHGFLKKKKKIFQYITFELKPYLLRTYGTTTIDSLVLNSPGSDSFKAAHALCNHCIVNTMCVPYFPQSLSRYAWFCFFTLKEHTRQHGIRFTRKA